jgi:NitT/TauT family transport system permease protein
MSRQTALAYLLPALVALSVLSFWEWAVWYFQFKPFYLPAPTAIAETLTTEWRSLAESAWVTLTITAEAFLWALALAFLCAVLFAESRTVQGAFLPYAIALQTTPVVAIAPLILIWVGTDHAERAVLILAIIVAFFPILANTTLGLRAADPQLKELFQLYGASRWQTLWRLKIPTALPYLLAGMKISGGLALIGAVVAELSAGSGTSTGLAWRIAEAGNRLQIAKMFAALFLLMLMGLAIYGLLSLLEWRLLRRWHEASRSTE